MLIKNLTLILFIQIFIFLFLLLIDSIILALNTTINTNNKDFYVYKLYQGHKIDMAILLFITIEKFLTNYLSTKTYLLCLCTYFICKILLGIIITNKLKIKIDKNDNTLKIDKSKFYKDEKTSFNLELKIIENIEKHVIPQVSLELINFKKNTIRSYMNKFNFNKGEVNPFLKNVIKSANIQFVVDGETFDDFNKAFVQMVKAYKTNNSKLLNKEQIKEIYEQINPEEEFEKLNIPLN